MAKREILFRGWNKKNKKWIYGYYFAYHGYHFISPNEEVNPLDTYEDYVIDADTVGQYTGQKDAKGVKIFEGDIIVYNGCNHTVQYNDDRSRFVVVPEGFASIQFGVDQQMINECKNVVAGNVQENKELIKTK